MKELPRFDKVLLLAIGLAVGIKFFIDCFVPFSYSNDELVFEAPTLHKDFGAYTPFDDPEIVETALYYCRGEGFLTSRSFNRPSFRKEKVIKTAFRPKFSVFMHIAGVKWYQKAHPSFSLEGKHAMPKDYYFAYGVILFTLKWLFFLPALWFFYQLLAKLTDGKWALAFTFLFCIYPSTYYVGLLNVFEPIITYLMVCVLAFVALGKVETTSRPVLQIFCWALAVLFCVWMKPHILFTLFFFLVVGAWQAFHLKKWTRTLTALSVFFVVSILAQVPILLSNYADFGKVFLANQAGIDFFHAHNPYARGCWTPELFQKHGAELTELIAQNKDLPTYNEKQEADYYKQLATQWIYDHPFDEALLLGKKVLILFQPYNFLSLRVNVLTLFVHLGLLAYLFFFIKLKRYSYAIDWYILGVIAAIVLLNLLYFVEYRWRFFADPELLMLAAIGYFHLWNRIKGKQEEANGKVGN